MHERAIEAVIDNGLVRDFPDGTFCPGDTVTRGQIAVFLTRALDRYWLASSRAPATLN